MERKLKWLKRKLLIPDEDNDLQNPKLRNEDIQAIVEACTLRSCGNARPSFTRVARLLDMRSDTQIVELSSEMWNEFFQAVVQAIGDADTPSDLLGRCLVLIANVIGSCPNWLSISHLTDTPTVPFRAFQLLTEDRSNLLIPSVILLHNWLIEDASFPNIFITQMFHDFLQILRSQTRDALIHFKPLLKLLTWPSFQQIISEEIREDYLLEMMGSLEILYECHLERLFVSCVSNFLTCPSESVTARMLTDTNYLAHVTDMIVSCDSSLRETGTFDCKLLSSCLQFLTDVLGQSTSCWAEVYSIPFSVIAGLTHRIDLPDVSLHAWNTITAALWAHGEQILPMLLEMHLYDGIVENVEQWPYTLKRSVAWCCAESLIDGSDESIRELLEQHRILEVVSAYGAMDSDYVTTLCQVLDRISKVPISHEVMNGLEILRQVIECEQEDYEALETLRHRISDILNSTTSACPWH